MSVVSLQSGDLEPGLFIELDGEAYEIEVVDPTNQTFTLVEVSISYVLFLLMLLLLLSCNCFPENVMLCYRKGIVDQY